MSSDASSLDATTSFSRAVRTELLATLVICLTISTLLVWIRVYVKFRIVKTPGWGDCKLAMVDFPPPPTNLAEPDRYLYSGVGMA